jgi:hypothetical protein
MKPTTIWFIYAQLLDIFTTRINLSIPAMYEANPFMAATGEYWVLVKLATALVICLANERFDFGKYSILIPLLASLFPLFNIGVLIYYFVR